MKKSTLLATRGFTLIELLVTITIIGIMAAGAANVFGGAQAKARDSQRISDLEAIKSALELYYTNNDEYPNPGVDGKLSTVLAPYLNKMPVDPKNGQGTGAESFVYTYAVWNANSGITDQIYVLSAHFESDANYKKHNVTANAGTKSGRYAISNVAVGKTAASEITFSDTTPTCPTLAGMCTGSATGTAVSNPATGW